MSVGLTLEDQVALLTSEMVSVRVRLDALEALVAGLGTAVASSVAQTHGEVTASAVAERITSGVAFDDLVNPTWDAPEVNQTPGIVGGFEGALPGE